MKIVFMGTPDFAEESLKAIYASGYEIVGVVTNPDRPKGRGMKMIPSPVKEFAIEKNLKIYQPEKIKNNEEFINELKNLKPDIICVVAYGKILPKEINLFIPLRLVLSLAICKNFLPCHFIYNCPFCMQCQDTGYCAAIYRRAFFPPKCSPDHGTDDSYFACW